MVFKHKPHTLLPHQLTNHMITSWQEKQLIIEQAMHSRVIKYPIQLAQRQVKINQGQLISSSLICLCATKAILARKPVHLQLFFFFILLSMWEIQKEWRYMASISCCDLQRYIKKKGREKEWHLKWRRVKGELYITKAIIKWGGSCTSFTCRLCEQWSERRPQKR